MAKTYTGNLSLEWYNKQYSIILKREGDKTHSDKEIPAPKINWVNKEDALFYKIIDDEGRGFTPYWVNSNDIRIKEARPLILQKVFKAVKKDKKGTLPGTTKVFYVEELNKEDSTVENILIKGDNLLGLNALKKHFENKSNNDKIKLVYIDVPFNTGAAFQHYDDNLSDSEWLTLMRDRLVIIHQLMQDTGVIVVHLDDTEVHYLKVLMDSIFGRNNFICTIACKSSTPSGNKTAHRNKTIIKQKDFLLVYGKSGSINVNPQYIARDKWDPHYSNYFNRNEVKVENLVDVLISNKILPKGSKIKDININDPKFKRFYIAHSDCIFQTQPSMPEEIKAKSLKQKDKIIEYKDSEGSSNYALNGRRFAFLSESLNELDDGTKDFSMLLCDFWSDIDFQNTQNEGNNSFPAGKKPEKLLQRIIKLFTEEGDIVFDCFAGSGTTCAVAHKLNRKWIGIEIGNHANTHIVPRLCSILDGSDRSGISETCKWQGGGSFKYYHLGPSIINFTKDNTGDFNWSLGKFFIEESLLLSYDYTIDNKINLSADKLFSDKENQPVIGVQKIGSKNRVAIVSLNEPKGKLGNITYDELQALYKIVKKIYSPEYINIFTNRGIEIAYDSKPEDLDVIKVPSAIFAELIK